MVIFNRSAHIVLYLLFLQLSWHYVIDCLAGQDIVAWIVKNMNMDNDGICENILFWINNGLEKNIL